MTTNKPVLKSADQFMADYRATYQTIWGLFQGKAQQYSEEVGKLNFKRVDTVGDIRAKDITPKDTEYRQIAVNESSKTFKKYFKAIQFRLSQLQDQQATSEAINQVLDEANKQYDEMLLTGEGTSDNDVINNGLFFSGDSNHVTQSSYEIPTTDRLYKFHDKIIEDAATANLLSGQKLVMFYGSNILPLYNSLYASAVKPFKVALQEVLGPNFSTMEMPAAVTPASSHGYLIVNLDQIKVHYVKVPGIHKNGTNEEVGYNWWNFLTGSVMVDVLNLNGIVKRPLTLAA